MIELDRSLAPATPRILTSVLVGAAVGTAVGLGAWWALGQFITAASGTGAPAGLALAAAALAGSMVGLLLMQRTLREQAAESDLLRMVVESTSAGAWIVDDDLKTVWLNESMHHLLGEVPPAGTSILDYFVPESRRKLEEARRERRLGISSAYQARLKRRDGQELAVYIVGTPIHGSDGDHLGSFGFFLDITDQQRAAEQATEQARVETLMATVARLNHKINNALMVIRGQAEVSVRKTDEETVVRAFQRVIEQVDIITDELTALSELREVQLEEYLGTRSILRVPERPVSRED